MKLSPRRRSKLTEDGQEVDILEFRHKKKKLTTKGFMANIGEPQYLKSILIPESRDDSTILSEENNPIIYSSYNYYLISGQKQVGYVKNIVSPIKSMKLFSFESYPVHLGQDKCPFKVEVSLKITQSQVLLKSLS